MAKTDGRLRCTGWSLPSLVGKATTTQGVASGERAELQQQGQGLYMLIPRPAPSPDLWTGLLRWQLQPEGPGLLEGVKTQGRA